MRRNRPYSTAAGYRPSLSGLEWGANPAWMREASCAGSPTPDAWHEVKPRGIEWAVSVCQSCPVSAQCLQFALSDPSLEGIWGGTTPEERVSLSRKAKRRERRVAKGSKEGAGDE